MLINFQKKKYIYFIKSDNQQSEISIEDDGPGYPKDILNKIGEPYIKSEIGNQNHKGLGLGIFIGKTLLERNRAKVICRNSQTRSGAEVVITWKNSDLKSFNDIFSYDYYSQINDLIEIPLHLQVLERLIS